MPMTKLTDMSYKRSTIGVLLGYGTFVLESAGQDQALSRIDFVPRPDQLFREISELLFGRPGRCPRTGTARPARNRSLSLRHSPPPYPRARPGGRRRPRPARLVQVTGSGRGIDGSAPAASRASTIA